MRLAVRNMTAGYGTSLAVRAIDLVVPAGRTVALLGANGAGKTTTLKAIAGVIQPSSGEIWFDHKRVERFPDYRRSRLGLCLIPEGRGVFPQLTVRDNLAMFARGKDVDAALDRAVSAFPVLGRRMAQEAGTMSGGEQQMLAVARAFVFDAPVILADELSMGLAPLVIEEIFAALETLRAEGRSILVVEQYVHRVLRFVDYVYVLHKGEVVFVGEPAQCEDDALFEHYLGSVA